MQGEDSIQRVTSARGGGWSHRAQRVWFSFTVWGRPAVGRGLEEGEEPRKP